MIKDMSEEAHLDTAVTEVHFISHWLARFFLFSGQNSKLMEKLLLRGISSKRCCPERKTYFRST